MTLLALVIGAALAAPPVPERAPETSLEGDLSQGTVLDNAWAHQSNVACFPATMARYFSGAQQQFVVQQEPSEDLVVRITSKDGTDLNLYALQLGFPQAGGRPPTITSAWRCTPGYAKQGPEAEVIRLSGTRNAMEVVIGVVGADGATKGGFTVEIWEEPARF